MVVYISIVLLTYLELASLGLITESSATTMSVTILPPLCTPCECVSVSEDGKMAADCSGRNLKMIPGHLSANIVSLNLDGNNLMNVDDGGKGICEMYRNLKSVSLTNTSLTRLTPIVKGCDKTLEEIDLTGNNIIIDAAEAFPHLKILVSLEGLTVPDDIEREFFYSLKKLRQLELSYNGFSFPADLFSELSDLRSLRLEVAKAWEFNVPLGIRVLDKLYLRGPRVRSISSSIFSDLINLTTLDLDLPQLNAVVWQQDVKLFSSLRHLSIKGVWEVNANTIAGLKSLQTLQLKGIYNLRDSALFEQQGLLEVLEITDSYIKVLPSSWFSRLTSLCDLNLTNNQINELKSDSLLGLSNLRNLVLSGNMIDEIPRDFLRPVVEHLENLSIDRNKLIQFEDEDLPRMKNLMALDLSSNSLSEFNLNMFKKTPNLVHLQLQGNRIHRLSGRLVIGLQRVNVSHNSLQKVPGELMVDSIMDLDISANPINKGLPVFEIMKLGNLKELTINGLVVKCDCAMQRLLMLKAVHGGECIHEGSETYRRRVGDIIYDNICKPESNTRPLSDNGYSIIERAIDGSDSNTKNENNVVHTTETPEIQETGNEDTFEIPETGVESNLGTEAPEMQETGHEGNVKYDTSGNQETGTESNVRIETSEINGITGNKNNVENDTSGSQGQEIETIENVTSGNQGPEIENDIENVASENQGPEIENDIENVASENQGPEIENKVENVTSGNQGPEIENNIENEIPEVQGTGNEDNVKNDTSEIQSITGTMKDFAQNFFKNLYNIGNVKNRNNAVIKEHIFEEGDALVKEHKDDKDDTVVKERKDGEGDAVVKEHKDGEGDAVLKEHKDGEGDAVLKEHKDDEGDAVVKEHKDDEGDAVVKEHKDDEGDAVVIEQKGDALVKEHKDDEGDAVLKEYKNDDGDAVVKEHNDEEGDDVVKEHKDDEGDVVVKEHEDDYEMENNTSSINVHVDSTDQERHDDHDRDHTKDTTYTDRKSNPRVIFADVPSTLQTTLPGQTNDSSKDRADPVKGTASNSNDNASSVKGTALSGEEGTDTTSDVDDVEVPAFVFVLIALAVIGFIGCAIVSTLVRHVRRSGSHNLDHSRRNLAHHGELDETKMIMTELGKSRLGQEVVVM